MGGVMALKCKIADLQFVTEHSDTYWTIGNWLALGAFVNNIAGIINRDEIRVLTMLEMVCDNESDEAESDRRVQVLRRVFVATLVDRHPLWYAAVLSLAQGPRRWQ